MAEDLQTATVADLTLERVRRLDVKADDLLRVIKLQNQKIDGLVDLATGTRVDFAGFMKLYSAQEETAAHMAVDLGLIKKRLDLTSE